MLNNAKLKAQRTKLGLSQAKLAVKAGVSQQLVAGLETGAIRTTAKLLSIARALEVQPQELDPEFAVYPSPPPPEERPDNMAGPADFPIYAAAEGGPGEIIVSTEAIAYIDRPEILQDVKDSYGILITGESMSPEFEPGDTALVRPRVPPMPGFTAIFYGGDPRAGGEVKAMIKRVVGTTQTNWKVKQWNPPKDFELQRDEWPVCHLVVGKYARRPL